MSNFKGGSARQEFPMVAGVRLCDGGAQARAISFAQAA